MNLSKRRSIDGAGSSNSSESWGIAAAESEIATPEWESSAPESEYHIGLLADNSVGTSSNDLFTIHQVAGGNVLFIYTASSAEYGPQYITGAHFGNFSPQAPGEELIFLEAIRQATSMGTPVHAVLYVVMPLDPMRCESTLHIQDRLRAALPRLAFCQLKTYDTDHYPKAFEARQDSFNTRYFTEAWIGPR